MSALLGIDLGTSAVKLLLRHGDGRIEKARAGYESISPEGWLGALKKACEQLDLRHVDAVGLSSQVGTFIIEEKYVVGWNEPAGIDELTELKARYPRELFLREIGMAHPDMVSYPIPRIMYFSKAFPGAKRICMPKELLLRELTGNYVSDMYSWRGLADLENCRYSPLFMDLLSCTVEGLELPPLVKPDTIAGTVTHEAAAVFGMPEGAPVYAGCNDFFAALLGCGIRREGDMFDITGTSEHLGGIAPEILDEPTLISGRYFNGFVRYGVTASSGASLNFGGRLHERPVGITDSEISSSPVFLPYVNGERCPVCDPMARGVMFGIGKDCSPRQLAYAVIEGVAFNLRQIKESLCMPDTNIIVCGGSALDRELNQLKADILGQRLLASDEPDASALGAAFIAGIGCGEFSGINGIPAPRIAAEYVPSNNHDRTERYELFRRLYPAVKDLFNTPGRMIK